MCERGAVRDRTRAEQGRDFTGLRYGRITPTDIDAFLDFRGKVFVFIEAKLVGAQCPWGQERAFERLCDATQAGGVESVYLLAEHDTKPDDQIVFADMHVLGYRYHGRWITPASSISARCAVDAFLRLHGLYSEVCG
jgi:hypothetical protein